MLDQFAQLAEKQNYTQAAKALRDWNAEFQTSTNQEFAQGVFQGLGSEIQRLFVNKQITEAAVIEKIRKYREAYALTQALIKMIKDGANVTKTAQEDAELKEFFKEMEAYDGKILTENDLATINRRHVEILKNVYHVQDSAFPAGVAALTRPVPPQDTTAPQNKNNSLKGFANRFIDIFEGVLAGNDMQKTMGSLVGELFGMLFGFIGHALKPLLGETADRLVDVGTKAVKAMVENAYDAEALPTHMPSAPKPSAPKPSAPKPSAASMPPPANTFTPCFDDPRDEDLFRRFENLNRSFPSTPKDKPM